MPGGLGGRADASPVAESWYLTREGASIHVSGNLRTSEAERFTAALLKAMSDAEAIELDFSGVQHIDGGVLAVLRAELGGCRTRVAIRGSEEFRALFNLYANCWKSNPLPPKPESIPAHVGRVTLQEVREAERGLDFVGELTMALWRFLRHPFGGHWKELPPLVERTGADALPIVVVINFLIGFVMAFMSAQTLRMFGANIYVADLVTLAMTRQLSPMMTAIVVCGRSGAAFATELGSMKVAEEIDALRTMGLEPFGWLVLPRVFALVLALPLLTLLGDLVGMAGGMFVASMSLGISGRSYLNETRSSLTTWDVESGLWMSVAFALAIGLIACQQGFAASGGAQGVGRRTTKTVVVSLFALVVLDAIFAVLYRVFGLS